MPKEIRAAGSAGASPAWMNIICDIDSKSVAGGTPALPAKAHSRHVLPLTSICTPFRIPDEAEL
jgi:hypothetical protein